MMCAARLGQAGHCVALLDHAVKIGEKIRISGGGRCNFTNRHLDGQDGSAFYVSQQPRFVRHALSRYTAQDFMKLLDTYRVPYHEKHKGQMFCSNKAQDIIDVLQAECRKGGVDWYTDCKILNVRSIHAQTERFEIQSSSGHFYARYLVIATGGLAAPAVGATPLGHELAKQFGHQVEPPQAALVPLKFEHWQTQGLDSLAGVSLRVQISTPYGRSKQSFDEDLLFRHKGLSGPAILQISSYWQAGQTITINFVPEMNMPQALCQQKSGQKIQIKTALKQLCPHLPERLLDFWLARHQIDKQKKWADLPDQVLQKLGQDFNQWEILPSGNDGHKKAEVSRGGVDVRELDAKTMQSKKVSGLFFIGEVMDITGWLGGYNFQWAWSSAVCAAEAIVHLEQN